MHITLPSKHVVPRGGAMMIVGKMMKVSCNTAHWGSPSINLVGNETREELNTSNAELRLRSNPWNMVFGVVFESESLQLQLKHYLN